MKKIIPFISISVALISVAALKSFAVWPPSTAMEDEEMAKSTTTTPEVLPASQRLHFVVGKLEQDERRLDELLSKVEQHEQTLKKSASELKSATPVKKEENGHHLH